MLTMRRRGSAGKWYIRGTVVLGDREATVAEFSSGTSERAAASHVMAERERLVREELMFGPQVKATRAVVADAFDAYLSKPVPPHSTDVLRIGVMNERIGSLPLTDPREAWHKFRESYLIGHAPAGQDRYRSLLQAAINVYHERHGMQPIRLKAIAFNNERIRFLSHAERDQLIEAYAAHVRPIVTMFAFQGPRTQEALQLPWGVAGVDLDRGTTISPAPKPAILGASRYTRELMRFFARFGRRGGDRRMGTCFSTVWESPTPIPAILPSKAVIL